MPLFGKNKHENPSPAETGQNVDDSINGIPRDGGFGEKQRQKYDENHPEFMESNSQSGTATSGGNGQYNSGNTNTNTNSGAAKAAYREEERIMDERNGPGMGSGGNMNSNDPAMAQHHHHHHQQHNAAMGGTGATMSNQDPYANTANTNPNASDPYGNNSMSSGGGGGGFISNQHSTRLGQEAEVRRQQQGQGFTGQGGNRAEYDAMGFDTPPSRSNNNASTGTGYGNNNTSTGTNSNSMGGGSGGANVGPSNSLSLKEQADMKAREGEAMQKQAVEVAKAEQLEKAALAARQRAVDHGAHPLHGQIGGVDNARGNQA